MADFTQTITIDCPDCESGHVVKIGQRNGYQRYLCRACEKKFNTIGTALGRRVPAEHVGAAIDMYFSGMSYEQIAENMKAAYDMEQPSKATVYKWVRDYGSAAVDLMKQYPATTSGHWVADEMQLKVGGEKMWNWNVMDAETRYLLASHLSPNRGTKDAEAVFRKALAASTAPPKTIRSDQLRSYIQAAKTVFPDAVHKPSDGIRSPNNNNNLSERVQGTFRDRTKTLRGLQGRKTGQHFLDSWVLDYNLFRDHEAHGGGTPGEAAKVNAPFTEWADVTRGRIRPKGKATGTGERRARVLVGNLSPARNTSSVSGGKAGEYRHTPMKSKPPPRAPAGDTTVA